MKPKIVIALNSAWNIVNFRTGLVRALINSGYEVVTVAPTDEYVPRLLELGCEFISLPMENKGTNAARDLLLFWRLRRILLQHKPSVYLGYTVKPNIYGSLAAHTLGIPVINNIAGLGSVFGKQGWLNRLVRILYFLALSRSNKIFFQNEDDRQMFIDNGLVRREVTDRLPGSGIDLDRFTCIPAGSFNKGRQLRFLLAARMLWDKGVSEFVEAARIIKSRHANVEFCLLGFLDVQNPNAISRAQVDQWIAEGVVSYLGVSDDVRLDLAEADCVVLPSFYREGVPRILLEAAAMSKPIITTDSVGCRDVVDDGVNGYLCRPRDALDLAAKIDAIVSLTHQERVEMGSMGRKKVENEFDEKVVIQRYAEVIKGILSQNVKHINKQEGAKLFGRKVHDIVSNGKRPNLAIKRREKEEKSESVENLY